MLGVPKLQADIIGSKNLSTSIFPFFNYLYFVLYLTYAKGTQRLVSFGIIFGSADVFVTACGVSNLSQL